MFILGTTKNDNQSALNAEQRMYQDLVQFDFEDSYLKLTVKVLSALYWTTASCNKAAYVAKVDEVS
jgi:hypothetical protein